MNTSAQSTGFPSRHQAINHLPYRRALAGTPLDDLDEGQDVAGEIVPEPCGRAVGSSDVLALLGQMATAYPEAAAVMDVAQRLIVRLETLRHEAMLPLSFGQVTAAMHLLKKSAEVCHE